MIERKDLQKQSRREEKNARADEIRRKYGLTSSSSKDLEEEGYKYKRMS